MAQRNRASESDRHVCITLESIQKRGFAFLTSDSTAKFNFHLFNLFAEHNSAHRIEFRGMQFNRTDCEKPQKEPHLVFVGFFAVFAWLSEKKYNESRDKKQFPTELFLTN